MNFVWLYSRQVFQSTSCWTFYFSALCLSHFIYGGLNENFWFRIYICCYFCLFTDINMNLRDGNKSVSLIEYAFYLDSPLYRPQYYDFLMLYLVCIWELFCFFLLPFWLAHRWGSFLYTSHLILIDLCSGAPTVPSIFLTYFHLVLFTREWTS
jgi:hypothetical protein